MKKKIRLATILDFKIKAGIKQLIKKREGEEGHTDKASKH